MTTISLARSVVRHPTAIAFGGLVGIMIALWWPAIVDLSNSVYDDIVPVVSGRGVLINRTDDKVIILVSFTRSELRESCKFLRRQGYAVTVGGVRIPINTERLDSPALGHSVPSGSYRNTWAMWPVDGAYKVLLYTQHDCGGRQVSTVLADVKL